MASIKSQLQLTDGMSSVLGKINTAMTTVLNSFEAMQSASGNAINVSNIEQARSELIGANTAIEQMEQNLQDTGNRQNTFNENLREGTGAADGLLGKVKSILGTVAAAAGIKKILGISDELTSAGARLELIVDDGGSVEDLKNKIFSMAQSSRVSFMDSMQMVSKLGILAGKSFSGNNEMIRFTELLNKNFVVAGASAQETTSAMYQLTQAMASGRLQGDEFRSIRTNAPLLAQSIEDYMRASGVSGTMKEWSADGLITAEVIKNALFSSADEVEAKFESMPMTWAQIWTSMSNYALQAFTPILTKINQMANSETFNTMVNGIIGGVVLIAGAVVWLFDLLGTITSFFIDNWSLIAPIVLAIAAAFAIYYGQMMLAAMWAGIVTTAQATMSAVKMIGATITAIATGATIAETAAQWGLNAALYACPLVWIIILIIAIIAIIYLVIAAVNKFAGTSISATGVISGAFAWLGSVVANIFMGLLDLVFGIINAMVNPFIRIANFIGNVFTSPVSSIIYLFQSMADGVLGILQTIASALDFVFGSKMADSVKGWRAGLKDMADAAVAEYAPNENYQNVMDELDLSVENTLGWKRFDNTDAYNAGYSAGENLESSIGDMFSFDDLTDSGFDMSTIAGNTGDIADSSAATAGALTDTKEDLKYLRDLAEQEAINRFTTAKVEIDFSGMTNKIDSSMDLDGVISTLTEGFAEALEVAAEGVPA